MCTSEICIIACFKASVCVLWCDLRDSVSIHQCGSKMDLRHSVCQCFGVCHGEICGTVCQFVGVCVCHGEIYVTVCVGASGCVIVRDRHHRMRQYSSVCHTQLGAMMYVSVSVRVLLRQAS